MPVELLRERLAEVEGIGLRLGEPMSAHLPLRVGGPAEIWVVLHDPAQLGTVLTMTRKEKVRWRVCWPFERWLARDGLLGGVTIRPGRGYEGIQLEDDDHVRIGAATPWAALRVLGPEGWWTDMATWPGCPGSTWGKDLGPMLAGRCRAYTVFHGRGRVDVEASEELEDLRPSMVLESIALGPGRRLRTRPVRTRPPVPSCLFADLGREPAGAVLARAGLVGSRLKQWRLSSVEPGTIVQLGGGSHHDLQLFARGINARTERTRGLSLDLRLSSHGDDRRN